MEPDETKNTPEDKPIEGQTVIGEEKSEAIAHKDSALKRLDASFNKHIELYEYKKSNLLAYWINDFSNYHDNEKSFDTTTLKTFKRGDIVKVNLGFNVGAELGGLHYCVVINKNDNPYSGALNIVPLSSAKEDKIYNESTCINLGDELFLLLMRKFENESDDFQRKLDEIKNLDADFPDVRPLLKKLDYLQKIKEEISRMKHGSIAYIHQITTISKQRIFKTPILSGIHLSNESLNLIDEKIKQLYTK